MAWADTVNSRPIADDTPPDVIIDILEMDKFPTQISTITGKKELSMLMGPIYYYMDMVTGMRIYQWYPNNKKDVK